MEKIIEKLSAYNIFTNLFPGVVYCYLAETLYGLPLLQDNLVIGAFVYYFVGMVISRIGSLVVEPGLIRSKFVKYADYSHYLAAVKDDSKLEILLETNNSYRSVLSLLLCVGLTATWTTITSDYPELHDYSKHIITALLFGIFLFSYRKQTKYIAARVAQHSEQERSGPLHNDN